MANRRRELRASIAKMFGNPAQSTPVASDLILQVGNWDTLSVVNAGTMALNGRSRGWDYRSGAGWPGTATLSCTVESSAVDAPIAIDDMVKKWEAFAAAHPARPRTVPNLWELLPLDLYGNRLPL